MTEFLAHKANETADRFVQMGDLTRAMESYRSAYAFDPAFHAETGMPMDCFRALSRLVCPYCHAPLSWSNQFASCPNCAAKGRFPVVCSQIPVFLQPGQHGFARKVFGLPPLKDSGTPIPQEGPVSRLRARMAPTIWRIILNWLNRRVVRLRAPAPSPHVRAVMERTRPIQGNSIYNIYMKTAEAVLFIQHLPVPPSLEFGGNYGHFTNLIYGGHSRITYSSEYLADPIYGSGFLQPSGHDVFDCLFSSTADCFPLPDASLQTVLSMHILDHILDIDGCLAEAGRVLKPGGQFVATTYGNELYLPEFGLLDRLGLKAGVYRRWRLTRANPRGGGRYLSDGDYATGQNLMPLSSWRALFETHGFELRVVHPYSRKSIIALLMDVEYQGYYCPVDMVESFVTPLSYLIEQEVTLPIAYETAQNVFFIAVKA